MELAVDGMGLGKPNEFRVFIELSVDQGGVRLCALRKIFCL